MCERGERGLLEVTAGWPKTRTDWIALLLDVAASSAFGCKDLLGIISDYLMGHEFVNCKGILSILDDGNACGRLINYPANLKWAFACSRYPISGSNEFSVVIQRDSFETNPDSLWPVCVGLVNPRSSAGQQTAGRESIWIFSDTDCRSNGQDDTLHELSSLPQPWPPNTTVTVRLIPPPRESDSNQGAPQSHPSVVFIVNGVSSKPIPWPESSFPDVPYSDWRPAVGIRGDHINTISFQ